MHITVAILCLIAEERAELINNNKNRTSANIGDDTYFGCRAVFEAFTNICNAINLPLADHKTIINEVHVSKIRYFEFLKRHSYNGTTLLPISTNRIKNFLKSPVDNIYSLIADFDKSGVIINVKQLFHYCISKIKKEKISEEKRKEKFDHLVKQLVCFLYLDKQYNGLDYTRDYLISVFSDKILPYLLFLDKIQENKTCKALYLLNVAKNTYKRIQNTHEEFFHNVLCIKYNSKIMQKFEEAFLKLKVTRPEGSKIDVFREMLFSETGAVTPIQAILAYCLTEEHSIIKNEGILLDELGSNINLTVRNKAINDQDILMIEETIGRLKRIKVHSLEEIFGEMDDDLTADGIGIKPKLLRMLEDSIQQNISDTVYRNKLGAILFDSEF